MGSSGEVMGDPRLSEAAEPSRISVVIPCRNEIHNLPRVWEMLRRQTLVADEIVVVDGASNDGSREWLAEQCRPLTGRPSSSWTIPHESFLLR
jgi:cellulose synthase/poly-beta-1,6-N-acetylglucosamine synthase-like glycosyltransferase